MTDHGYDAYRRLTTLQDAVGTSVVSAAFAWDKVGNLTKEWSARVDGTVGERFSYDDFGRMTAAKVGVLTSGDMDVEPFATAAAKRTVGYGIDAGNNWSTLTETLLNQTPQTTTYTTTDSPRYVQISTGGASGAPTYDGEGNLTYDGTHYLVYDFKNRLSEVWRLAVEGTAQVQSGTFVAPDEMRAGRRRVLDNVFERERGVERDHQALKRQGRLKTQVAASGAAQSASLELVALYGYDPFNRRLLRIVTGSGEQTGLDQRFAYDGWREVEEFAADGEGLTSTKAFVWGNRIDELLAYHRRELGSSTWQSYYPVQGRLDSVCALRDASGAVVERVEYDLYGRASVYVGTSTVPQTSSSVGNPHLYTGRRLDGETGFVYLRNRYLHTGMGRFLTVDPIGSWGDQAGMGNGYAYAGNSPATFSDPSGRSVLPWYDGPINLPPGIMAAAGPGDRSDDACQDSGQRWAIWLEWNSGEEMPGHMSLAIGDPNGEYVSYSFYAADEIGAIIGGPGEVRVDTIHGGVIERDSFHWITEHDARAIRVSLGVMAQAYRKLPAEQKHGYCAHYYNCRWWSRKQLGHILRYLAADPARGGAGRPGRRGSPPAPRSAGPGGIGAAIGVVVGAGAIRFSRAIRGGGFILAYDAWAVIAEVNSLWSY